MTKHETALAGLFRIELSSTQDKRGGTVKTFAANRFTELGLPTRWTQTLLVRNPVRGTLRGMHWQSNPSPEAKLVHCLRGRVFDVIVDVRPASATFGAWEGFHLSADDPVALLVPPGLAHGYLTLEDGSELLYQIDGDYSPEAQRVFRWDDPSVGIDWPFPLVSISDRDAAAPNWSEALALET